MSDGFVKSNFSDPMVPLVQKSVTGNVFPLYYCCWICHQPADAPVLNICGHIFCYNCALESHCPACHCHLDANTVHGSTVLPVYSGIKTYRTFDGFHDNFSMVQKPRGKEGEDESDSEELEDEVEDESDSEELEDEVKTWTREEWVDNREVQKNRDSEVLEECDVRELLEHEYDRKDHEERDSEELEVEDNAWTEVEDKAWTEEEGEDEREESDGEELEDDDEREEVEHGDTGDDEKRRNIEHEEKMEAEYRLSTPIHPAFRTHRLHENITSLIFVSIQKFKSIVVWFRLELEIICQNASTGGQATLVEEFSKLFDSQMKTLIHEMVKDERWLVRLDKKTGTKEHQQEKPLLDSDVGTCMYKYASEKLCSRGSDNGTCTCKYLQEKKISASYNKGLYHLHESANAIMNRDFHAFWLLVSPIFPGYSSDPNPHGFRCNICSTTAYEPVVTLCGHLFCWPCIYAKIATSKFLSGPCPTCGRRVHVSRSRSNVNPVYSLTNGKAEDAILYRGRKFFYEADNITAIPPRPSFHHPTSRFMSFVLERVKDCMATVETKLKRLCQECSSLKPNEVVALSHEIQDLMDEAFMSLVKSWRCYVGEDHDEYELKPSLYDSSYDSLLTEKTEWMKTWDRLTDLGLTYHSEESAYLYLRRIQQARLASRSKTPVESAPACVTDSHLIHSDSAMKPEVEAACIEDKFLEGSIKENKDVVSTLHLHVPEKEKAHVTLNHFGKDAADVSVGALSISIPSCLVEPAISEDNIDLADSQTATSRLNFSHPTADSGEITTMSAPSLNSQHMESSADIWLVEDCPPDLVEDILIKLQKDEYFFIRKRCILCSYTLS